MFERIREDFDVYGRRLRNRALWAMVVYRFGQWADRVRFRPLRWLLRKAYGILNLFIPIVTGITIDCDMKVGRRFHIIHAGPLQIHPDTVFGDRCGVMHHVTIGVNMDGGVPRFGNDVFVGAGAVVVGEITIGDGARIAANSLVITDVPPDGLAMGVPARIYPQMGNSRLRVPADKTTVLRAAASSSGEGSKTADPADRKPAAS
jgi:serine O-acetyltransferase